MREIADLLLELEDSDLEVKAAQGRDGSGAVPDSMWETYSAMANTDGGVILLGVTENDDGSLRPIGIANSARVQKSLWDSLNNSEKVSANVLRNTDVSVVHLLGLSHPLIRINVPRAPRKARPVYIGPNPLTGSFRRNYEGDYRCTEEEVRRMIAEAEQDARDGAIQIGFGLEDLDQESLLQYRRRFRATKPNHAWAGLSDKDFLQQLGGYRTDRATGEEGLTTAGLLMFGSFRAIHDAIEHYAVDYREFIDLGAGQRWSDRVTTDGSWSGNLFDFFRLVFERATRDLKVPFRLSEGGQRVDESRVHEAIREALVNSLIHADYAGRIPIVIDKHPDHFTFRNPGDLRLPRDQVLAGGISDCRNPRLQKMFQLIGLSEKAGSGMPHILAAWTAQHWRQPELRELFNPAAVELDLRMISLFPSDVLDDLVKGFPDFQHLSDTERVAVATAKVEERVTNRRIRELTELDRHSVGQMLRKLVAEGFLSPRGRRGGRYYELGDPEEGQGNLDLFPGPPEESEGSESETSEEDLRQIASKVRDTGRANPKVVRKTIAELCQGRFLSIRQLAELLGREPSTLRTHYLPAMVKEGVLRVQYPDNLSHPAQAYRTVQTPSD